VSVSAGERAGVDLAQRAPAAAPARHTPGTTSRSWPSASLLRRRPAP